MTPTTASSPLGALSTSRRLKNVGMTVVIYIAFALAVIPLVWLAVTVVRNGLDRFFISDAEGLDAGFNLEFLQQSMRGVFGAEASFGGIAHAINGTLLMTLAATVISVPIGLLTAIYLVEYGSGWLKRAITFFVDVMTGIPSIVAGLFAYSLFAIIAGPGTKLGIVGAVALSVLMIPVVVRSSEEMLRLVPNELREASYALGVPKWLTVLKVVVRTAIAGITTGVTLAIARVIGETAPLLVAVGVTDSMNLNLFEGRMMSLPVYIISEYEKGALPCATDTCIGEITQYRAWAAALVLILIVMALNLIARLIARFFSPKTGR
ncbi:phosphate ABC transporter permease PstA [Demequina mangrovi]|uniref:Phosphate transport system permease protein PstA n=1 Tax=Demequina mangrovi TaxID=1043493 RepID=A0A1H6YNC3_9MICO|nr:phosphate ABC transporter permease PstA [Demequina mangrovi]SEJ38750.1 phosphate ABC transporter membrane protein 2, PhoT family [Demequina mangrovi]